MTGKQVLWWPAVILSSVDFALFTDHTIPIIFIFSINVLQVEELFLSARHNHVAASAYPQAKGDLNLDLIAMVKAQWEAKV